jgi:hypothetical protein
MKPGGAGRRQPGWRFGNSIRNAARRSNVERLLHPGTLGNSKFRGCRGRCKTGQRRNKTGQGDGTKPDLFFLALQWMGDQSFGSDYRASSAGYGSAGEQPERRASPKGLLPPGRVLAQCFRAVRIWQPHSTRRVSNDQTIDFEGRNYEITTTLCKSVCIVHHPDRKFWVVDHPPKDVWPPILDTSGL